MVRRPLSTAIVPDFTPLMGVPAMTLGHRRTVRLAILALMTLQAVSVFPLSQSPQASAGTYETPGWLPFRGTRQVNCTNGNTSTSLNCAGYHGYPAIDFKLNLGAPVYPSGAGKVHSVQTGQGKNCPYGHPYTSTDQCPNGAKGNWVIVHHGGSNYTFYTHLSKVSVSKDEWVTRSTKIGEAGDSGLSTPGFYHLHYEERSGSSSSTRRAIGALKGCSGATAKAYPQAINPVYTNWNKVPAAEHTVRHDGGCGGGESDFAFAEVKAAKKLFVRMHAAQWEPFTKLGADNWSPHSSPAIASDGSGGYWLAAIKETGRLYTRHFDGSAWGPWQRQGADNWSTMASPSLTVTSSGAVWFVAVKDNGKLYTRRYTSSGWGGFRLHGAPNWSTTASPAIASAGSAVWFVAVKDNGKLYTRRYTSSGWGGFRLHGAPNWSTDT